MSTVLLVDDDPAVLARLSRQLESLGHEVLAADRPEQAISLVEDGNEPALAVLEVSMPDMTGFELASILHECPHTRELPVLFVSEAIESPATFTEDGVTAMYLNKNSVAEELPEAVEDLLSANLISSDPGARSARS